MRRVGFVRAGLAIGASLAAAAPAAAVTPSFTVLGTLPGHSASRAWDVSVDGLVVVGSATVPGGEAFRWENGVMVGLFSSIHVEGGVSADGAVVVGTRQGGTPEPVRWEGGVTTGLGSLGGLGAGYARSVSADGSVVVGSSEDQYGQYEAFRWTAGGGMVGLGSLVFPPSEGFGVSGDGSVVVGLSGLSEAIRWTQGGGMVSLGALPGAGSPAPYASDASDDGSVIVGLGRNASGNNEAFRWEAGVMTGLGDLPGGAFDSRATSVSADGEIVVGFGATASAFEPFRWDAENGMLSVPDLLTNAFGISLTGWTLALANAVSPDGRVIVGTGTNPSSLEEAWMAVLPLPDEYDFVPAGPSQTSLEGGTSVPGGLEILLQTLAGGTVIAQYLTSTQQVLGQGIDLSVLESAGFRIPGEEIQAWDIDFVGELDAGSTVSITFAYDESLLSVPESLIAIFHIPEEGSQLICSPDPVLNTCPQLAVVDTLNDTITVTVPNVPSIDILAERAAAVPALGPPALALLAATLLATATAVLRRRRS